MKKLAILSAGILILFGCTHSAKNTQTTAEREPSGLFTKSDVEKFSSSSPLGVEDGRILIDNDEAFQQKLSIIRSAKKEIRMLYYIYSPDQSSSVLSQALIKKAQEGVKVKLIVDYLMGYKNYDFFRMLEREGRGNIEVRLYGAPTDNILESLAYLATPCPVKGDKNCQTQKWQLVRDQMKNKKISFYAKLFNTGLYAKNPNLIKLGAFYSGIMPDGKGPDLSADEKEQLVEFLKLIYQAQIKKDLGARLKLALALAFMGDTVGPIYQQIQETIPLSGSGSGSGQDWLHITDYLHHKLLLADDSAVQLGGRNIEDSYHMKKSPSGKYTFNDTDVYLQLKSGGKDIVQSFDKLWNYKALVKSLNETDVYSLPDFLYGPNTMALATALETCKVKGHKNCDEEATKNSASYVSLATRMDQARADMIEQAGKYQQSINTPEYKSFARQSWSSKGDKIPGIDSSFVVTYIENLTFSRADEKQTRKYGSTGDKGIHELWVRSMDKVCRDSLLKNERRDIYFLNAYVFLPGNLFEKVANMVTGKTTCPNVHIHIATNSFESTDLNIINVFGNYQFMALFKMAHENKNLGAKIRIYEMNAQQGSTVYSLHSKLSLIDDKLIIGSANADPRSYMMDTNNGFFMTGNPELTSSFKAYLDRLLEPSQGLFTEKTEYYTRQDYKAAIQYDRQRVAALVKKYDKKGRLKPEHVVQLQNLVQVLAEDVFDKSYQLLKTYEKDEPNHSIEAGEELSSRYQVL